MSDLEDLLALHIRAMELPAPEREYKFHKTRRWRWDFAWVGRKLAVEVNGGTWVKSGHTSGGGIARDYEKVNAGQLCGWRVLQFTKGMIEDGTAIELITEALKGE